MYPAIARRAGVGAMMKKNACKIVLVSCVLAHCANVACFAQSYAGDARRIGLGGTSQNENIGSQMIEDERQYRSIVVPFGLIQVIQDRDYFNPDKDTFNPVRALEDIGNPLHITLRRGAGSGHFVSDVYNATLTRDLNAY